jgi:hypothetical protein
MAAALSFRPPPPQKKRCVLSRDWDREPGNRRNPACVDSSVVFLASPSFCDSAIASFGEQREKTVAGMVAPNGVTTTAADSTLSRATPSY